MENRNSSIFSFSKYFLKTLVILTLLLTLLDYVFERFVVLNSDICGAYKIHRILHEDHSDEIAIFGSSRAQGSFVPSKFNTNVFFNYGIPGIQANVWLFFLEQELRKDKDTPILINFDLDGLVYLDGDIANYLPNWSETKHITNYENHFYYYLPFVRFFGRVESYIKYYLNERTNLTKVTENGGSFEKNKLTQKKFDELVEIRRQNAGEFKIEKELSDKLFKTIRSTSRKIYFVISPYHYSYFESFTNINEVNRFIKQLSQYENVEILDYGNAITNDSCFINTTHLNYVGAQVFSEMLKKDIVY